MQTGLETNADVPIPITQPKFKSARVNLGKIFEKGTTMELYNALLKKRLHLASVENCMPSMIALKTVIIHFTLKRPSTLEEVASCQFYISTPKRAMYAKEFLDVIQAVTVKTVQPEQTIEEILSLCPIVEDSCLSATAKNTYRLLSSGKSVEQIAVTRGYYVRTILDHLSECIKFGYPVKLTELGINKENIQTVIQATEGRGLVVNSIKSACPNNITTSQVKAVVAYLQVREHLEQLAIPYKEFEDCNYFEFYKLITTVDAEKLTPDDDNLAQFISDLEECFKTYDSDEAEDYLSKGLSESGFFSEEDLATCGEQETSTNDRSDKVIDLSDEEPPSKRYKFE